MTVHSLDALRLPDTMLSDRAHYLSPLNFATNFVFFREGGGHHTRLVSANYWGAHGVKKIGFWCYLYDEAWKRLAQWEEQGGPRIARSCWTARKSGRASLCRSSWASFSSTPPAFAGHDVVKYALDTYGDAEEVLSSSCTHDANSWPAYFFDAWPAPAEGEEVGALGCRTANLLRYRRARSS